MTYPIFAYGLPREQDTVRIPVIPQDCRGISEDSSASGSPESEYDLELSTGFKLIFFLLLRCDAFRFNLESAVLRHNCRSGQIDDQHHWVDHTFIRAECH